MSFIDQIVQAVTDTTGTQSQPLGGSVYVSFLDLPGELSIHQDNDFDVDVKNIVLNEDGTFAGDAYERDRDRKSGTLTGRVMPPIASQNLLVGVNFVISWQDAEQTRGGYDARLTATEWEPVHYYLKGRSTDLTHPSSHCEWWNDGTYWDSNGHIYPV